MALGDGVDDGVTVLGAVGWFEFNVDISGKIPSR